ncbi:hypothetical protein AMTRI_Chr09g12140 [Amborella trichopoda]
MDRAKHAARVPNIFESVNVPRLHGYVGCLEPNCYRKGERCPIEPRMVSLQGTITADFIWESEKKFSRQVRSETIQTSLFHFSIPLMSCLAVVYRPTEEDHNMGRVLPPYWNGEWGEGAPLWMRLV